MAPSYAERRLARTLPRILPPVRARTIVSRTHASHFHAPERSLRVPGDGGRCRAASENPRLGPFRDRAHRDLHLRPSHYAVWHRRARKPFRDDALGTEHRREWPIGPLLIPADAGWQPLLELCWWDRLRHPETAPPPHRTRSDQRGSLAFRAKPTKPVRSALIRRIIVGPVRLDP